MTVICPSCGLVERTVAQQIGGRLVFSGAAATFGAKALKNPLAAILLAIAGYAVGKYLDDEISKRCPRCGAILRITGLLP
jgi:hypothetical protein